MGGGFLTDILGASLLAAIGLGFGFVTSTIAAVSGVEEREQGVASGLINTSQQIGGALGLAVLSTIATTRTDDVMATGHSTLANGLTEGFQSAFLGGAVIAALGFVATLVLIRTRDSRAHVEMANAETPGRARSLAGLGMRGAGARPSGRAPRLTLAQSAEAEGFRAADVRGAGPACAPASPARVPIRAPRRSEHRPGPRSRSRRPRATAA